MRSVLPPIGLALGLAFLSVTIPACKKDVPTPVVTTSSDDGGASADSAPPPVVISYGATSDGGIGRKPPSTGWAIASSNLDADIAERAKRNFGRADSRLYLIEVLLERGQYLANVADFERADEIAKGLIKEAPAQPLSHFAQALTLGAFHKFEEELKELDAAEKDKEYKSRASASRLGVYMALGRYADAEKLLNDPEKMASPTAIVTAAVLFGHMQKIDESEKLFERARDATKDVSPFPIAWMDFQRGLLLEGRQNEARARLYYLEAVEAIPTYVHAVVHLAATDKPEDAVKRLEDVRKVSPDPDILAALADAKRKLHLDDEAKTLTDLAKKSYDELVAKHPEAYRDHAARFWLAGGDDPKKALDYAEKNAKLRPTEEAIDLWMGAAAGANRKDAICASAIAMSKLTYASEGRKRLAAAASNGCPDSGTK